MNDRKGVYAEDCPATAFRQYIDKIMNSKQKPKRVIFSQESVRRLCESEIVSEIGGEDEKGCTSFFWAATEKYPRLDVTLKFDADKQEYILLYIKEEADPQNNTPEFIWKDGEENNNGEVIVYKKSDPLEDLER